MAKVETVTTTATRFEGLAIRTYRNVTRVGVPGHARPFRDSWTRFVATEDDADVGPSFHTRQEAFSALAEYAAKGGYSLAA